MVKYAPRKVYIRESGGYVELSYTEFCRCRESDQTYMDKLFIPIQGCLLEVVREQYTDFYRDKERWRYLQKLDTKNRLLSLDGFTDSEGNPLDFITDEAVDIAETVVNAVMVDRLKAALPLLSDSEQELIQAIFFDGLSEREVGARLGITQSVVNKRLPPQPPADTAVLPAVPPPPQRARRRRPPAEERHQSALRTHVRSQAPESRWRYSFAGRKGPPFPAACPPATPVLRR